MSCKKPKVIGPFLGFQKENKNALKIHIAVPFQEKKLDLTCVLTREGDGTPISLEKEPSTDLEFGIYTFYTPADLISGKKYFYRFETESKELKEQILKGISEDDLYFYVPTEFGEEDYFVLTSCHNPEAVDKAAQDPWGMWKRLEHETRDDPHAKLLLLGGDQVYCDTLERDKVHGKYGKNFVKKLKKNSENSKLDRKIRSAFIRQYHKFWKHSAYRKVLARIPSLAMWDDHDITDGWGSRLESFKKCSSNFKENWIQYQSYAAEAFENYQNVRNPQRIHNGAYSTFLDLDDARLYLLDLRSGKNVRKAQIWSEEHKESVLSHLRKIPESIKNVFVVTPTVGMRTNFKRDERIGNIARLLHRIAQLRKDHHSAFSKLDSGFPIVIGVLFLAALFNPTDPGAWTAIIALCAFIAVWVTYLVFFVFLPSTPLGGLADDIADGLSSDASISDFRELLEVLFDLETKHDKKVFLLSGDIHSGGISEFVLRRDDGEPKVIPQIVSSPIAYEPMPKEIEGITSATAEMEFKCDPSNVIVGRNIFYVAERNFAKIFPMYLTHLGQQRPILFYFEGLKDPMAMHETSMPF